MLKRLFPILGLAALVGAGYAVAAGVTVTMTADGPQPAQTTVAWGDTVTFTNADNKIHQITIPRVSLRSPEVPAGGTFEYVLDGRRGNYGYRQTGGGPNKLGTIVVELKGTITMNASATIVRWGSSLRLSGTSTFPGPINVAERVPRGAASWVQVATAEAGPDGSFALELKPERGAQYRAQAAADQVASGTVRVSVQPIVTIRALARRAKVGQPVTFIGRVTPAHAAAMLELQRFDARHGRWLTDLSKKVPKNGQVTFKWKAQKGAPRIRTAVRPVGLNDGWAEAASPAVVVTGVE